MAKDKLAEKPAAQPFTDRSTTEILSRFQAYAAGRSDQVQAAVAACAQIVREVLGG